MSFLLLANPTSGGGKGAKHKRVIAQDLALRDMRFTDISGSSYESARVNLRTALNSMETKALIIVGGDGLVHLAIQELANTTLPLIVIPSGTGNDFARSTGIPLDDPSAALAFALDNKPQQVDLGNVDGRFFAEILSTGFDSVVNERANRIRWQSKRKYDLAMLLELPLFKPISYAITLDDRKIETEAMLIAIANGMSYGGGMKVCPNASLTDGLFDLMILQPVSKPEFLRVFPKVFKGTHITHPQVRIERARVVQIEAQAVAYADGERVGELPIHAKVARGALSTWVKL